MNENGGAPKNCCISPPKVKLSDELHCGADTGNGQDNGSRTGPMRCAGPFVAEGGAAVAVSSADANGSVWTGPSSGSIDKPCTLGEDRGSTEGLDGIELDGRSSVSGSTELPDSGDEVEDFEFPLESEAGREA